MMAEAGIRRVYDVVCSFREGFCILCGLKTDSLLSIEKSDFLHITFLSEKWCGCVVYIAQNVSCSRMIVCLFVCYT